MVSEPSAALSIRPLDIIYIGSFTSRGTIIRSEFGQGDSVWPPISLVTGVVVAVVR